MVLMSRSEEKLTKVANEISKNTLHMLGHASEHRLLIIISIVPEPSVMLVQCVSP